MPKNLIFILSLLLTSYSLNSQMIRLEGNQMEIPLDASNVPQESDGTLFPETAVGEGSIHTFTMFNTTDKDISVVNILADAPQFRLEQNIKKIKKNSVVSFSLVFTPDRKGGLTSTVQIALKQGNVTNTYFFNIEGTGVQSGAYSGIMISQYYENNDSDFIEIANNSPNQISRNTYVLALYGPGDDLQKPPRKGHIQEIESLNPGEVRVYDRFEMQGDEIVIISSTRGKDCFKERIDMIGEVSSYWGANLSYSKGGCASEAGHLQYNPADWVVLDVAEVDASRPRQNMHLGSYTSGQLVWNGSDWVDGSLPDRTRIVVMDGSYSGELGDIEACDLIVNSEVNFDLESKGSIVVYRDLDINGQLDLGDTESLVMYDDQAMIDGVINKKERSTFRNNSYDFTYWSSPVENAVISEVLQDVNPGRIFYFDQERSASSDPDHADFWNTWVVADHKMVPGMGYAAEGPTGSVGVHEILFKGKPHNGLISTGVYHRDDVDANNDFNLLGNPYPSAIDIELFFNENRGVIDPTVYLWTHTTPVSSETGDFSFDDYATYNYTGGTAVGNGPVPTKNIGSSQGFFVRALEKGQVYFNNSMRLRNANDQFFKSNPAKNHQEEREKDRVWLNMTTDQGGFNQLLIGFIEGASDGMDHGYDALKFQGSNKIRFYSLVDQQKLAIQGLGEFDPDRKISLGFDNGAGDRNFSISIADTEGLLKKMDIYLLDKKLNRRHNLKSGPYTFNEREKGSFKNRFELGFADQALPLSGSRELKEDLLVYHSGNGITIKSDKPMETVRLYDIHGKMICEAHPGSSRCILRETNENQGGILIVQVVLKDQSLVARKFYR